MSNFTGKEKITWLNAHLVPFILDQNTIFRVDKNSTALNTTWVHDPPPDKKKRKKKDDNDSLQEIFQELKQNDCDLNDYKDYNKKSFE